MDRAQELAVAENAAEKLRREPYRLFRNDCLTKSLRLRDACRRQGIPGYVVWCLLGLVKARLPVLGRVTIPIPTHCWAEVHGQRLETSRPLGHASFLGIVPCEIRPLITIRV